MCRKGYAQDNTVNGAPAGNSGHLSGTSGGEASQWCSSRLFL